MSAAPLCPPSQLLDRAAAVANERNNNSDSDDDSDLAVQRIHRRPRPRQPGSLSSSSRTDNPNQLVPYSAPPPPPQQQQRLSQQSGALQLYDPQATDADAQLGMRMILMPTAVNGYPRQMQNAPLPPPAPPKTITRSHTIVKTRTVRTYHHGATGDDDDDNGGDDGVFEQESHSSWETSGSVSWEASDEENGGSSSRAGGFIRDSDSDDDDDDVSVKKEKAPRLHAKMVTRKSKTAAGSDNVSPKANGVVAVATVKKPLCGADDEVRPDIVTTASAHNVKHSRHSKTTTTVRHLDGVK